MMRIEWFLRLAVFSGAGLALHAAPAFAQTTQTAQTATGAESPVPPLAETLTGDAKQDYESGRRLYESGDYAGALSRFESASRASGDPRLLWDAAVCEQSMGHYARAITLVRRYLDSHSPAILPEAARNAQDFLDAARARTVRLEVDSSEPGAVVAVDGEPLGAVPLPAETRIDLGAHRLTVTRDGFAEYSTTVTVVASADVHVTAVLVPIAAPEGRLVVRAGSGDTIAVDGTSVGVGTWAGALPPGPHSVRVTEPDSVPFESEVAVEAQQTRSIDVTLRPQRHAARVPAWVWIAGGTVLAAGAVTAGYFAFRSSEPAAGVPIMGTAGNAYVP